MNRIKAISQYVLAIFMIAAGTMHFVNPEFFLKIMPPYLPMHRELVLVSGVCEVILGILLLVPRRSRWAAWGIVALLIAVFPANLYLYQHQDIHASDKFLPVNVMHGKDVVLVEYDLITLIQSVQSSFNQRIVHNASKVIAAAFSGANPEIFSPATGRDVLLGERRQ